MELKPKKILLMEDEKLLSKALELKLAHEGFVVNTLPSGEGSISLLESGEFFLVICDLMMPKVDGFDVLQMAKDKNIKVPIIILTNLGQAEDEKKVRDLGAVNFFIKADTPLSKIVSYVKEIYKTTGQII